MNTICIIGAAGKAGQAAVKILNEKHRYKLILVSRNREHLEKYYKEDEEKIFREVNYTLKDLIHIMKMSDYVLNCAGPATTTQKIIVEAAMMTNCNLVDISGGKKIWDFMKGNSNVYNTFQKTMVLGAGVYPGLTELVPYYLKNYYFKDSDTQCKLFFFASGKISYSAAYDYILGIKDAEGMGGYRIGKYGIAKTTEKWVKGVKGISQEACGYPIITYELCNVAADAPICELDFYNIFLNQESMFKEMLLKNSTKTIEEDVSTYVRDKKTLLETEERLYLMCEMKDTQKKVRIIFDEKYNVSDLTGIMGALTLRYICENEVGKKGKLFIYESVNGKWLINELEHYGIIPVTISESLYDDLVI